MRHTTIRKPAAISDEGTFTLATAELTHQGNAITQRLLKRRACRRARRQRKTRYRRARFLNRRRREGWLPPSLESRIENILCWVRRLQRLCPITALSQELAKFDTQLMQNADISGAEAGWVSVCQEEPSRRFLPRLKAEASVPAFGDALAVGVYKKE